MFYAALVIVRVALRFREETARHMSFNYAMCAGPDRIRNLNPLNLLKPHAFICACVMYCEPEVQVVFAAGLPLDHVRDGMRT